MASEDLRDWLAKVDSMGELKRIEGADWNLELTFFANPKIGRNPTSVFLFDDIKGYPTGYRVVFPRLVTPRQTALTLNLPEGSQMDLVDSVRQKMPRWEASLSEFPPKVVGSGPVLENVHSGDDVDLLEFPVPKYNIEDGGRYIGTGDAVITRDPDTGEVNLGTYRVMVHDKKTTGIAISPAHHGSLHIQKYHAKGQACPIAISVGHHPLFFSIAARSVVGPEYNWVGAIREEPVKVVIEEVTGLPIPADSEIVIAGWCPPDKQRVEGPFGEWTGYYARPPTPTPIIEVERIYHRNSPILLGYPPIRPQPGHTMMTTMVLGSAIIHNELVKYGVPDVKGVWQSKAGLTAMIIVSVKQRYAGHAKRAALIASQSNSLQVGNYVIVVEEDIDPSNIEDVLWALCFRSDPQKSIEIIRNCRTAPLNPMWVPGTPIVSSMAIIDACRPYERLGNFPMAIEDSPRYAELVRQFEKKWQKLIP